MTTSKIGDQLLPVGSIVRDLEPTPPEGLTHQQAEAWVLGYHHGQITGPDSLEVITPYDVDEEADLYEAWADGMDAADKDARYR